MPERINDSRLYQKLMNHNAWTNGTLLDINNLGAGGSRRHLILANTQTKLGDLMTNSQLWDLINSIGEYEFANGLQRRDKPNDAFIKEYERLRDGGKYNYYFISDLLKDKIKMQTVRGDSI